MADEKRAGGGDAARACRFHRKLGVFRAHLLYAGRHESGRAAALADLRQSSLRRQAGERREERGRMGDRQRRRSRPLHRAVEVRRDQGADRRGKESARHLPGEGRAEVRRRRQVPDLGQHGGRRARDDAGSRAPGRARRRGTEKVVRVVISGASSGIGEALARHYASADTVLGLISRRRSDGLNLPGESVSYPVDVTDAGALAAAARDFLDRFGPPDLVIASAGISIGTVGDDIQDVEKLRRVLDVNVAGLAATLAAFAPAMREAGRGTLAGIASVAGFRGLPGAGAYSASKAAAISWLESLRAELRGTGVSVVCICPGYIDTPMTQVNPYRLPFPLPADEAARRLARAISARRRLALIPL